MSVVFMMLTVGFVCWEVNCEVVVEEMLRRQVVALGKCYRASVD
jgi:hypothetical protein